MARPDDILARHAALLQSLDCVYVHDLEGRLLDANQAWLGLLGYQRGELGSLHLASLMDSGQAAAVRDMLAELDSRGTLRTRRNLRFKSRGGSIVELEVSASVVECDGADRHALAIGRDVTERRQAERAAAQRDETQRILNRFSAELSLLPSKENLEAFILRQLVSITGGLGGVFVEYEPAQRALTVVDERGNSLPKHVVDFQFNPAYHWQLIADRC